MMDVLDQDEKVFKIGNIEGSLDNEGKMVLVRRLIVED